MLAQSVKSRLSLQHSPSTPTKASRLRVGKRSEGDTAGTADPNWLKGSSIPHDAMLNNKSRERGRCGDFHGYGVCLPNQPLHILRPCFPGTGWMLACQWQIVNKVIFLLWFHVQLLVFLLNCFYLIPWASPSFFLPLSCWREGVREWLCGGLAASQGQPTTNICTFKYISLPIMRERTLPSSSAYK